MGALQYAFIMFGIQRPDGFYPRNQILANFAILIIILQGIDWISKKRMEKGAGSRITTNTLGGCCNGYFTTGTFLFFRSWNITLYLFPDTYCDTRWWSRLHILGSFIISITKQSKGSSDCYVC